MEAKEFRIGNYLQDREGRLCMVENLGKDCFSDSQIDAPAIKGVLTSLPCKPIPLTEEWLEIMGFKDYDYYWSKGRIRAAWYSRTVATGERNGIYISGKRHIKYVHQVQNLYFALTGKEITINKEI